MTKPRFAFKICLAARCVMLRVRVIIFKVGNMEITVIDKSEIVESKWGGGVTYQLFIAPDGASYAERRFDFRISTAVVELEESTFTRLPGVTRYLTPLGKNGFRLAINGCHPVKLAFGEVLRFSGEDDITCYGSGRDLNLMLKGCSGDMRCLYEGEETTVPKAEYIFVYAVDDQRAVLSDHEQTFACRLRAGDFARLEGVGRISSSGSLVLFLVY